MITRLNILKVGAFLMLLGNEFHILGPWNRIENFLIFIYRFLLTFLLLRRNCKANPNCFNCLGERFWLGEIKGSGSFRFSIIILSSNFILWSSSVYIVKNMEFFSKKSAWQSRWNLFCQLPCVNIFHNYSIQPTTLKKASFFYYSLLIEICSVFDTNANSPVQDWWNFKRG